MTDKIDILEFVESLRDQLISTESQVRTKSIQKLTETVCNLPPDALSDLEVSTLLEFYCARLSDTDALTTADYVYKGLHFLCVHCTKLPPFVEVAVTEKLLREQNVQSWPQSTRLMVFEILDYFLTHRVKGLKSHGDQFLLNFCRSIEGERDPRCLLLVFRLFTLVCQNFSIGAHQSDLFEIVACYFPIDFNPPPNDPYGINAAQLSYALSMCLTAHALFAAPCYELIVEKLEEEGEDKEAILKLLLEACDIFPVETTRHYSQTIWEVTRKQALLGKLSHNEHVALQAVKKLVEKCQHDKGLQNELVSVIQRDCEPFMVNLEMQLVHEASKILNAVAEVSTGCCMQLADKLVPLIMERAQYDPSAHEDKQRSYQITYAPVLANWIQLVVKMKAEKCVLTLLDGLVMLCLKLVSSRKDPSVEIAGINLATALVFLELDDGLLTKMGHVLEVVLNRIDEIQGEDCKNLIASCSDLIHETAKNQWHWYIKAIYPKFIERLNKNEQLLRYLVWSVHDSESFLLVKQQYVNAFKEHKVDNLVQGTVNLLRSCKRCNDRSLFDFETRWSDVVAALPNCPAELPKDKLEKNRDILKMITFEFDLRSEMSFVESITVRRAWIGSEAVTPVVLYPVQIVILSQALCSLSVEASAQIPANFCNEMLEKCKTISCHWDSGKLEPLAASKIVSSLINKTRRSEGDKERLICDLYRVIDLDGTDWQRMDRFSLRLNQFGWLARACLLNCTYLSCEALQKIHLLPQDQQTENKKLDLGPLLLTKLFAVLGNEHENGRLGVDVLRSVLNMDPEFADSVDNTKAVASILYRQRILLTTVPLFIEGFNKANQGLRWRFFHVFTSLLDLAKDQSSFVTPEIAKLLPVLVLSLGECGDDEKSSESVMHALKQVLSSSDTANAIHSHMDTVTARLIHMLLQAKHMGMKLLALDVLKAMAQPGILPPFLITQQRVSVEKALKKACNDKKRLVRIKSGQVNNVWALS